MAATRQNRDAGAAIRRIREEKLDLSQSEFALLIGHELHTDVKQSTLSGWEIGRREVPAAALLAAASLAGISVDAALIGPSKDDLKARLRVALDIHKTMRPGRAKQRLSARIKLLRQSAR